VKKEGKEEEKLRSYILEKGGRCAGANFKFCSSRWDEGYGNSRVNY
jgi:hypothetical protein